MSLIHIVKNASHVQMMAKDITIEPHPYFELHAEGTGH